MTMAYPFSVFDYEFKGKRVLVTGGTKEDEEWPQILNVSLPGAVRRSRLPSLHVRAQDGRHHSYFIHLVSHAVSQRRTPLLRG